MAAGFAVKVRIPAAWSHGETAVAHDTETRPFNVRPIIVGGTPAEQKPVKPPQVARDDGDEGGARRSGGRMRQVPSEAGARRGPPHPGAGAPPLPTRSAKKVAPIIGS